MSIGACALVQGQTAIKATNQVNISLLRKKTWMILETTMACDAVIRVVCEAPSLQPGKRRSFRAFKFQSLLMEIG